MRLKANKALSLQISSGLPPRIDGQEKPIFMQIAISTRCSIVGSIIISMSVIAILMVVKKIFHALLPKDLAMFSVLSRKARAGWSP